MAKELRETQVFTYTSENGALDAINRRLLDELSCGAIRASPWPS